LLSIEGINASFSQTRTKHIAQLAVKSLQIDDQLREAFVPVVLSTERWTHDRDQPFAGKPFLSINVQMRRGTRSKQKKSVMRPLIYIHTLAIQLTPIDVHLEELLVARLLASFNSMQAGLTRIQEGFSNSKLSLANRKAASTASAAFEVSSGLDGLLAQREEEERTDESAILFVEDLMISETLFVVSFVKSEGGTSSDSITFLTSHFGALVKLNDAHLAFTPLSARNVDGTAGSIIDRISTHYKDQFTHVTVKLVFSTEFMGNPMMMFRDFRSGVSSLKEGDVGKFITYGVAGVSNTAGSFASYAGSQLRQISGDDSYSRKTKPTSFAEGAREGAKSFGLGLLRGISGVIATPVDKVREKGAKGLVPGLVQGVVGVVAQPVAGALDFFGNTTQGLHSEIVGANVLERRRYPRFISSTKIITAFNGDLAYYQYLLTTVDPKFRMKSYVDVPLEKSVSRLVLLTSFDYSFVCFEVMGPGSARLIFEFPPTKFRSGDNYDFIMKKIPSAYVNDGFAISQISEAVFKYLELINNLNTKSTKQIKPYFL